MWNVGITHYCCISHLSHHILHRIIPHQTPSDIPNHTTFHVTPSFLTVTNFKIAPAPLALSTLFHFAIPYFKSLVSATICITLRLALYPLHITDVPHNAACHTPYSDHTIYWPQSFIVHRTTTYHITQLIAPHFTCFIFCIIPPHLTDHTEFHNFT